MPSAVFYTVATLVAALFSALCFNISNLVARRLVKTRRLFFHTGLWGLIAAAGFLAVAVIFWLAWYNHWYGWYTGG